MGEQLPYIVNNQTVVSAGGLDIKVVGNTITFTIGQTNWEMSVAELEAMLESHLHLKDACLMVKWHFKPNLEDADQVETFKMIDFGLNRANA